LQSRLGASEGHDGRFGLDAGVFDKQHQLARSGHCHHRTKNAGRSSYYFKWINQNLCIKRFLGTSEYAVKTQIWCAVATYVLIAIASYTYRNRLANPILNP
jgi:IS4 transposase